MFVLRLRHGIICDSQLIQSFLTRQDWGASRPPSLTCASPDNRVHSRECCEAGSLREGERYATRRPSSNRRVEPEGLEAGISRVELPPDLDAPFVPLLLPRHHLPFQLLPPSHRRTRHSHRRMHHRSRGCGFRALFSRPTATSHWRSSRRLPIRSVCLPAVAWFTSPRPAAPLRSGDNESSSFLLPPFMENISGHYLFPTNGLG